MSPSPIILPVIALLILAMSLAYAAGAYCQGVWGAVTLVGSGIISVVAVFIEASDAYSAGLGDSLDEENE